MADSFFSSLSATMIGPLESRKSLKNIITRNELFLLKHIILHLTLINFYCVDRSNRYWLNLVSSVSKHFLQKEIYFSRFVLLGNEVSLIDNCVTNICIKRFDICFLCSCIQILEEALFTA